MSYSTLNFTPVAKKVDKLYIDRLKVFLANGEYKERNLAGLIEKARVRDASHVKIEVYSTPDLTRPRFHEVRDKRFVPTELGKSFGPSWSTHWFKVALKVPAEYKGDDTVIFRWNCSNEGLAYDDQGNALIAFSGWDGHNRDEWIVPKQWLDDSWHTIYIESSCNGFFGNGTDPQCIQPPDPDRTFLLKEADILLVDPAMKHLALDFDAIVDTINVLPENALQRQQGIEIANRIMDAFDPDDRASVFKCREIAQQFIGSADLASNLQTSSSDPTKVYAVGHCHIDSAWLWPFDETRRKVARSWSAQLDLMDKYPEYKFVASQAVQFQWLKEDYPDLFARVVEYAKKGRFIPVGGSWVESDGNIPSGEAIIRQFMYGQRFFEEHFGVRCKTFWLPDTFGYSAQLPQFCRGAGMTSFLTQKLSWNNINQFPNSTFNWIALDGTQVVCHMPPSDTCNSDCSAADIVNSISGHKNLAESKSSLLLFGYGDGGGGANTRMIEKLRRLRGIADTTHAIPAVVTDSHPDTFFDEIVEETNGGKELVTWTGELYFEFHRGTYTTHGDMKRWNRESEVMMHDLEMVSTLNSVAHSEKYPKALIDECWKRLLLNQFHDVLPGCSIEMVYVDAKRNYDETVEMFLKSPIGLSANSSGQVVFNTLPWDRTEVVEVSNDSGAVQKSSNGRSLALLSGAAQSSMEQGSHAESQIKATQVSENELVIENAHVKVTVTHGSITSIIDHAEDRELLVQGPEGGIKYVIYDDQPPSWQGWDTEIYSLRTRKVLPVASARIVENGPLRATIEFHHTISDKSSIVTHASLDVSSSKLTFTSNVAWHESFKFLKIEFPVDINNEFASYDTMSGVVRRPTHYNTSLDYAKFEVCCHKFADLSDHSYGVTILNDSKYGFATAGKIMRLSLLRSTKAPDGNADMGDHSIRFALLGHAGGLNGHVVREAIAFNHPLRTLALPAEQVAALPKFAFVGPENIILASIKRAEDDADVQTDKVREPRSGKSVVLRVYDSLGGQAKGFLTSTVRVKKAFYCNYLEDDLEEVPVEHVQSGGSKIPITVRQFQVSSYRLELE